MSDSSSLLLVVMLLITAAVASVSSQALPNCQSRCGLVENIFYPFGFGDGCFREGFDLQCNDTYNPPKLFLGDFEIIEMLPSQGQVRTNVYLARDCYDPNGNPLNTGIMSANLAGSPFSFSASKNRFVATGCDTLVYMIIDKWIKSIGNVDECEHPDLYRCYGVCNNTLGDYDCTCPPGFKSDDPKTINCTLTGGFRDRIPSNIKWAAGIGCGLFFLVIVLSLACWEWQRRNIKELKRKLFEQNGGVDLQQYIESSLHDKETRGVEDGSLNMFRIYKLKELEKATKNFDKTQFLGRGGCGSVYKGELNNNKIVAVKKSKGVDMRRNKEYAREIFILSQTNHVNVVKLLGCCLEVDIPLLVYEYMANGTLSRFIHDRRSQDEPIPWAFRLRLAAESAKAFAYLHSEASPPILHGDIKSSNILLDSKYGAKVSDFGTSTHAPNDKAQINAFVQGTPGYLDPEYLQTGELTDKSDVYSFGVVLAELLTGKKAITEDGKYLSSTFIASMKSGHDNLLNILDPHIMTWDGTVLVQVREVADLTLRCLNLNGENRPEMTMISEMLSRMLQDVGSHSWMPNDQVENERLVGLGDSETMTIVVSNSEYGPLELEGAR